MLYLLHQASGAAVATVLAKTITAAFSDAPEVFLVAAESPPLPPTATSWDDLLLVLDGQAFPDGGRSLITEYISVRPQGAAILPVALDAARSRPPAKAESIKAFVHEATEASQSQLVNRIGALLGLRWQGRASNLFISYRAKDGKEIAVQIYDHLVALGHRPFLDDGTGTR